MTTIEPKPKKKKTSVVEAIVDDPNILFDEEKKKEKKKKSVSENYYNIPEDELQKIIEKAKNGDGSAQNELLKIFNNFITKYISLLLRGRYDLHDYDIRKFISLFMTDNNIRIRLRRNKINHNTYKAVNETMRGINYMIKRYWEEIDVKQTVQMSFLQCVMRYQRKGSIPFSGFLYSYFYYLLKKNVDAFLVYQLGRKSFPLYTDDSVSSSFSDGESDHQSINTIPSSPSVEELIGTEEIDEFWIIGEKCLFPFDQLTVQQRQLIKWRYVDGLKASQIAIKTTEHPNTCRAQIQEIREEIRSIIEKEFTISSEL
jgi:hypothetical protein